jgi:DNA-binding NarL/FixJ family response regulator
MLSLQSADIVLMDIFMPKLDGFEALTIIKDKKIDTKVITISSHIEGQVVQKVMNIGAKGFLNKSFNMEEIIYAIEKVYNGELYISKECRDTYERYVQHQHLADIYG